MADKSTLLEVNTLSHNYSFVERKGYVVRTDRVTGKRDEPFPKFSSRRVARVVTCEKGEKLVVEMSLPGIGKTSYTTPEVVTGFVEKNVVGKV